MAEHKDRDYEQNYPSIDELNTLIMRLGPCSITEILQTKKIDVNSAAIKIIQRRAKRLEEDGYVRIKKSGKYWVMYPAIFDEVRKKELEKIKRSLE